VPGRIDGFVGFLKSRMEAGQFRAIIDRKYAFAEIADAYRYVETGQKVGIVVIDVTAADERARVAQDNGEGTGPQINRRLG
jgi:Zinc-binding dehydrogenase